MSLSEILKNQSEGVIMHESGAFVKWEGRHLTSLEDPEKFIEIDQIDLGLDELFPGVWEFISASTPGGSTPGGDAEGLSTSLDTTAA